jgi:hypothetical protein
MEAVSGLLRPPGGTARRGALRRARALMAGAQVPQIVHVAQAGRNASVSRVRTAARSGRWR